MLMPLTNFVRGAAAFAKAAAPKVAPTGLRTPRRVILLMCFSAEAHIDERSRVLFLEEVSVLGTCYGHDLGIGRSMRSAA